MVVQPRNADALAPGARPHSVPFLPSSKRFDLQTLWLGVVHNGPPSASSPSLVLLADRVFVKRANNLRVGSRWGLRVDLLVIWRIWKESLGQTALAARLWHPGCDDAALIWNQGRQ